MIKYSSIPLLFFVITLCACRDTPKETAHNEEKLMLDLFRRADYKPNTDGEGYFFYKTYGLERTESYTELTLSVGGHKAVMREIYSPKRGGEVSKKSREVNQAEIETLMEIIRFGEFWSSDVKFEQTSLGGGVAVLGGWKTGTVKLIQDIPPEAHLAKAEAWFSRKD